MGSGRISRRPARWPWRGCSTSSTSRSTRADLPPEAAATLAAGAVLRAWRFHRFLTRPAPAHIAARPLPHRADRRAGGRPGRRPRRRGRGSAPGSRRRCSPATSSPSRATRSPRPRFAARLAQLEREGVERRGAGRGRAARTGARGAARGGRRRRSTRPASPCCAGPARSTAPPVAFVGKGITFDTGGRLPQARPRHVGDAGRHGGRRRLRRRDAGARPPPLAGAGRGRAGAGRERDRRRQLPAQRRAAPVRRHDGRGGGHRRGGAAGAGRRARLDAGAAAAAGDRSTWRR